MTRNARKSQQQPRGAVNASLKSNRSGVSNRRFESTGVKLYDDLLRKGQTTVFTEDKARSIVQPILREAAKLRYQQRGTIFPGSLNRLERWDVRMEKGNLLDERTPFYLKVSRTAYKSMLWHLITSNSRQFELAVPGCRERMLSIEEDQLSNFGPQSQFLPWSLDGDDKVAAVMSNKSPGPSFNEKAYRMACADVSSLLRAGSIHKTSIEETVSFLQGDAKTALDPSKNSGAFSWISNWGRATSDGKTFRDATQRAVFNDIMVRAKSVMSAIDHGASWKSINLVFTGTASQRTVSKGMNPLRRKDDGKLPKVKRAVIAMPKIETVLGKTIMIPVQQALTEVRCPTTMTRLIPAWSPMPVLDKNMQLLLEAAEKDGEVVLSGDISSFDATLPPFVMWDAAVAMSKWMDKQTANLFLAIMYADVYQTYVLTPTKVFDAGPSSVKSGSIFTSLVGCIANFIIQRYGHHAGYYTWKAGAVMGDDFVAYGKGLDGKSMEKAFADFNMEANASKAFAHRGMLHFLQRTHVLGYPGGMGSIARVCGNMLSVEDDTQMKWGERNKYTYLFQGLARLENAAFNPEFESAVTFMSDGDQLHLGKFMDVREIERQAGDYAQRKLHELETVKSRGELGVPFERWAVNRVLRGERIPPVGKARFEWYYGIKYDSLAA